MFRDWQGNAGDIDFLEGIVANEFAGHLPRYTDDRGRIHHRRGDPRHQVGRSRTRGGHCHPHLTACTCISVRRVGGSLLMPDQNVMDRVFQ